MQLRKSRWGRSVISAVALAVVLGVSACGNDDDAGTGGTDSTAGPDAPGTAVVLDEARAVELQAVVDGFVASRGIPGVEIAVVNPTGRWQTVAGVRDLDTGEPVVEGLRWPIRSITKSFTVTLLLQLVDAGEVSLDDPISRWVDGVPNGEQVTLRQLADMTSGLPDYTDDAFIDDFVEDPERVFTTEELVGYAIAQPPRAEPGADRVYTNVNTVLLGQVIEEVTGQPFEVVLREGVLEPMGLDQTTYPTSMDDWVRDAVGYSPDEEGLAPQPVNFSVFDAAGAMVGTVDDLLAWGPALAGGALLEPSTQDARLEGGALDEGPEYDRYAVGIGSLAGWWGHTGDGFGFTALVMHDRATDSTVAIVMNISGGDHQPTALFRELVPLLLAS